MKVAVFVKDVEEKTPGQQKVYQLDPPLEGNEFVVVSAVDLTWMYKDRDMPRWADACETYIFPSDGESVIDYRELPGSLKNTMSHEEALNEAGYEIEPQGEQQ